MSLQVRLLLHPSTATGRGNLSNTTTDDSDQVRTRLINRRIDSITRIAKNNAITTGDADPFSTMLSGQPFEFGGQYYGADQLILAAILRDYQLGKLISTPGIEDVSDIPLPTHIVSTLDPSFVCMWCALSFIAIEHETIGHWLSSRLRDNMPLAERREVAQEILNVSASTAIRREREGARAFAEEFDHLRVEAIKANIAANDPGTVEGHAGDEDDDDIVIAPRPDYAAATDPILVPLEVSELFADTDARVGSVLVNDKYSRLLMREYIDVCAEIHRLTLKLGQTIRKLESAQVDENSKAVDPEDGSWLDSKRHP